MFAARLPALRAHRGAARPQPHSSVSRSHWGWKQLKFAVGRAELENSRPVGVRGCRVGRLEVPNPGGGTQPRCCAGAGTLCWGMLSRSLVGSGVCLRCGRGQGEMEEWQAVSVCHSTLCSELPGGGGRGVVQVGWGCGRAGGSCRGRGLCVGSVGVLCVRGKAGDCGKAGVCTVCGVTAALCVGEWGCWGAHSSAVGAVGCGGCTAMRRCTRGRASVHPSVHTGPCVRLSPHSDAQRGGVRGRAALAGHVAVCGGGGGVSPARRRRLRSEVPVLAGSRGHRAALGGCDPGDTSGLTAAWAARRGSVGGGRTGPPRCSQLPVPTERGWATLWLSSWDR